ncbi:MAG: helix-turn-helix domain-containing protein [Oscillospiraceae bacterium]|nr:helix-turn-helix domain-containing protein [Oscillospiraceae bacterium]
MNEKKPFGDYIRKKRLEAGLTQRELAEQLFVTESTISKWERALSYPDGPWSPPSALPCTSPSTSSSPPATTTRPTPRSGRRRCGGGW